MFTNADLLKISFILNSFGCFGAWNNGDHLVFEFISNLRKEKFQAEIKEALNSKLLELYSGFVVTFFDFVDGPGENIIRIEISCLEKILFQ